MESVAQGATAAMLSAGLLSFIQNLIMQASLNKVLGKVKGIQIIVHLMLINMYRTAHAEKFNLKLLEIANFEFYDPTDYFIEYLPINESDPINERFEATGYESSDFFVNAGMILVILSVAPALLLFAFILGAILCCCPKVALFLRKQIKKTFFNRIIFFAEGTMIVLATCSAINLYQHSKGEVDSKLSYYVALGFAAAFALYSISITSYLCCKSKDLEE